MIWLNKMQFIDLGRPYAHVQADFNESIGYVLEYHRLLVTGSEGSLLTTVFIEDKSLIYRGYSVSWYAGSPAAQRGETERTAYEGTFLSQMNFSI